MFLILMQFLVLHFVWCMNLFDKCNLMKMDYLLGFLLLYFGSMFLFVVVVVTQDYNCWWGCNEFECELLLWETSLPFAFVATNDIVPICYKGELMSALLQVQESDKIWVVGAKVVGRSVCKGPSACVKVIYKLFGGFYGVNYFWCFFKKIQIL